jgi:predicted nucleotide-binding protein
MPTLQKDFYWVRFPFSVIKNVHDIFGSLPGSPTLWPHTLKVEVGDSNWQFDSIDEFGHEYDQSQGDYSFGASSLNSPKYSFFVAGAAYSQIRVSVTVEAPERAIVLRLMTVIEDAYKQHKWHKDRVEKYQKGHVKIFIGHGRDNAWRQLKDHLVEKHNFQVVAYETGPRAGLTIKEVLEEMIRDSSFALLVHTGEDEMADGTIRTRDNVIHETGLCQGRLGFRRAIVLLEDGCAEFSNLIGVTQIRFGKGKIAETYGDVIATISRELTR